MNCNTTHYRANSSSVPGDPTASDDLLTEDGQPRLSAYGYADHPLRPQLERVLAYVGLDPADHVERFSGTVTPFVLETRAVRDLIADVEQRSGRPFAEEFVARGLTEFFLYSGWRLANGRAMVWDQVASPVVWPRNASREGVQAAIEKADQGLTPFFAVHRRAFERLKGAEPLARFWVERGLFPTQSDALRFISSYRRSLWREPWKALLMRASRAARKVQG